MAFESLKAPAARGTEGRRLAVPEAPRTLAALLEERRTTSSLPVWAASRAKWSRAKVDVGGRSVPVLNEAIAPLTPDQRSWLEARIAEIERLLDPSAGTILMAVRDEAVAVSQEEAKLVLVTKMLMAKPSAQMTEEVAAARGEAFMHALADVPAWSVDKAIRGWHAGTTAGVENRGDFTWAPDCAVLRRAALDETKPLSELLADLVAVRDAKRLGEIFAR